ncbi:uncharacterized protein LOC110037458 [Phalaenopsis equestris]|uniref:uncharacterized protein LOC110037458 n=1 Tax=Phalaenopsis equestris TaxID=78828 RepID=UPI0009E2DFB8|nr:uncharacterized protein LOC110037458 [Phalaenopsis equestris]
MEAKDETLALFDSNWFYRSILSRTPRIQPQPPKDNLPAITPNSLSLEPSLTTSHSGHRCSRCEEHILTPLTSIQSPKFQTIYSLGESRARRMSRDRHRRDSKRIKNWGSRSLSDLEFEELKGFMDLGFTFSNTEASDPWLISIVPGLQRLRTANGSELTVTDSSLASEMSEEMAVTRPYLSEVWEVEREREERSRVLRNWRTPGEGEGIELKDHLRFWAQAVASAVV